MSDYEVFEGPDGQPAFSRKTDEQIETDRVADAKTLAAVREWAEQVEYEEGGYEIAQRQVLAILNRSDTDE